MSRKIFIAISLLFAANAHAGSEGACSAASLINPFSLEGGISGTGAPANGGISGTGSPVAQGGVAGTGSPVAEGGVAGTGISVAKGGVSGTGSPISQGGVAGTGSPVAEGGVAGTGISVAKGGVSGTGSKLAIGGVAGTGAPIEKGGGIGGTGDSVVEYALLPQDAEGDVGIMGVVTGFASICVNGEEVQYDSSTPIYDNGKSAKLADLAVGKTVMLKVSNVNGILHARAIGLFNAVSGPIKGVDVSRQQINVMGQTVHLNQNIVHQLANASPNAVARVSGYRLNNGNIVASRVDLVNDSSNVNTLGLVTELMHDGFIVDGTKVSVSDKHALAKVKVGSEVQVSGKWSDGSLKANHIETQPIKNVVSRVNSAILEGYVHKDGQNHLSLSGTEVSSIQDSSNSKLLDNLKGKLVKVELRRNNKGKWVTETISERKDKVVENETQFQDNSKKANKSLSKDDLTSSSSDNSDSSGSSNTGSGGSGQINGQDSSGSSSSNGDSSGGGSSALSNGGSSNGTSGGGSPSSEGSSSGWGSSGGSSGGSSRPSGGTSGGSSHPSGGSSGGGGSSRPSGGSGGGGSSRPSGGSGGGSNGGRLK
jgi:hypothetical protein